ncbi:MAG: hypothetical protein FD180_3380 [Planctomycetota bacterium]|nr:MAG: hypothetical protein FD180_3380 [Planctomycetota bacterium]
MRVRSLPPVFHGGVAEKKGARFLNGPTQVRSLPSPLQFSGGCSLNSRDGSRGSRGARYKGKPHHHHHRQGGAGGRYKGKPHHHHHRQGGARPADPSREFRVCTKSDNRAGRNPAALAGSAGSTPAAPITLSWPRGSGACLPSRPTRVRIPPGALKLNAAVAQRSSATLPWWFTRVRTPPVASGMW